MGILALDRFFGFGYFMSREGMERGKLTEDSVPRDTRDVGKTQPETHSTSYEVLNGSPDLANWKVWWCFDIAQFTV